MANIEDVHKKLIELHKELLEITTVGIVNGATEAKQDDIIAEIQNLLTEVQTPSALATQSKQNDIIAELQSIISELQDVSTEAKQDDIISKLTGSQRNISAVEATTAGSTTAGVQSVSLLFDGNGGTLNGVSVPNKYFAGFTPNGTNDTVNAISYTPPTGSGRIIITYVL